MFKLNVKCKFHICYAHLPDIQKAIDNKCWLIEVGYLGFDINVFYQFNVIKSTDRIFNKNNQPLMSESLEGYYGLMKCVLNLFI